MNPFQQVKDAVIIEMMKEIAKKNRKQPVKMIEELVYEAYQKLKQYILMSSFKTFKRFLSDRPVVNNPADDKKYGMNDKDKRQQRSKTLYGSKTPPN